MKTINKIILLALVIISFSCTDVLEEDITDNTIQIISPTEGNLLTNSTVNFQWNWLKGADKYRIQIFNSNQVIVLDSLVKNKLNLNYTLPTGGYKWRVRGENFAYQSIFSFPVSFSTAVSNILTNQMVSLSIPNDNFFTKSTTLALLWQPITTATSYDVEIVTSAGNLILPTTTVTSPTIILNSTQLALEANYIWKVKAKNSTTNTETPFASRTFSVDRTDPNLPQNNLPANNSLTIPVNQAITFSWTAITDSGAIQSPISYTIEYSNTNAFSTIIRTVNTLTTTSQQTFVTTGDYYWRVKATDAAGNNSAFTVPFMFKII
jgi:heme/copper-type cytochrome/quinol oxidase subunit 2